MRKGITPIISIIVLLLITVALAGAAWTYMSGYLGVYTEKSFVIPTGGAYCQGTTFNVRVVNTGTSALTSNDFLDKEVVYANSTTTCTLGFPSGITSVAPKGNTVLTCSGGTAGSSYTIKLGTIGGTQRIPVTC